MIRSTTLRMLLAGALCGALSAPSLLAPARAQQPQPTPPPQNPPQASISVEVPAVNVDAVVTDQQGNILTGLQRKNFRIYEDGQPQEITNFAPTDAPITIVMLMEFSRLAYGFLAYTAKNWSYDFVNHLGPKDWVALVTYDIRPTIVVDFTQNKQEIQNAILRQYFPSFREANEFDALMDTLDRLKDVEGKKSVLLISSGFDTLSHHTFDDAVKRVRQSDVTVFCVGVAEPLKLWLDSQSMAGVDEVDFVMRDNQLRTFAELTGGYAWFPRFDGELPGIFQSVAAFLRNQYTLAYTPANQTADGKYRKIKVEVVDNDGTPLMIADKKGRKKKVVVYARQGYQAPKSQPGY